MATDETIPAEKAREIARRVREEDEGPKPLVVTDLTEERVARFEAMVNMARRIRKAAISMTSSRDWIDQDGNPYATDGACQKVAALLGMNFVQQRVARSEDVVEGRTIITFVATLTAEWMGQRMEIEGVADSTDPLFSKAKGGGVLPLSEVDLSSLRKKAVTNAQGRAARKKFFLQGLSWEEVQESGIKREGAAKVDRQASKAKREDRTGEGGADLALQVWNMLADLSAWTDTDAIVLLKGYSGFTGNDGRRMEFASKEALQRAKPDGKWLQMTHEKVLKAWKEHPARARSTDEMHAEKYKREHPVENGKPNGGNGRDREPGDK